MCTISDILVSPLPIDYNNIIIQIIINVNAICSHSNLEAKPFISVCECYKMPTIMHMFRESSSNGLYHHDAPFYVKMGTGIYQCSEMSFGLYLAQLSYDRQLYFNNWRDSLSITNKLFCFKIPSRYIQQTTHVSITFSGNPDGNEML